MLVRLIMRKTQFDETLTFWACALKLPRRRFRRPPPGQTNPMNFDKLRRQAQQIYVKRGGSDAAKADGEEIKGIFKGPGTMADKAKAAAAALKDPGGRGGEDPTRRP